MHTDARTQIPHTRRSILCTHLEVRAPFHEVRGDTFVADRDDDPDPSLGVEFPPPPRSEEEVAPALPVCHVPRVARGLTPPRGVVHVFACEKEKGVWLSLECALSSAFGRKSIEPAPQYRHGARDTIYASFFSVPLLRANSQRCASIDGGDYSNRSRSAVRPDDDTIHKTNTLKR